ncbi:ATP-binding protein [Nocardioides sp.]|uniref:sensor histidine kinase n=1 Tax=Nocardioides sp. TaxID=35761 RepID=UPI0039E70710
MLLIPIVAALVLGGIRMASAVSTSAQAARAESLAAALPDSFQLALQLQVERDSADLEIDDQTLGGIQATTDALVTSWREKLLRVDASEDAKLGQDLGIINGAFDRLGELRTALAGKDTRLQAQTEITNAVDTLLALAQRLPALDNDTIYRQTVALGEVAPAADALGKLGELVTKTIVAKELSSYDLALLAQTYGRWDATTEIFVENTSSQAREQFQGLLAGEGGDVKGSGAPVLALVEKVLSTGDASGLPKAAEFQGLQAQFLSQMAGVITQAATDLSEEVTDARKSAQRDAVYSAIGIFVVLLLALLTTLLTARSILSPLSQLRQLALDIAQRALPERVRQFEESDGEALDITVQPLPVARGDEIGEVAEAFDAVHAEAVRLAGEQAEARANVNRMFVNLSRRSQSLVERQLRLIDELEASEQDPDHLSNLFRLDHLATRMRRNDESLMVLAGGDTGQGTRGPVPVLDVLRAASSEVEQFARVEIESAEAAKFRGAVAGDLVHLLAELIENATNFSPPDTSVVVRTSRTSSAAPLVIEIRDLGIGMTPEEMAAANAKLQAAGELDADVARMMGLVVTSRLAHRHALSVELRGNTPRGIVARVTVPTSALAGAEGHTDLLAEAEQAYPIPSVDLLPPPAQPLVPVDDPITAPIAPLAPVADDPFAAPLTPSAPEQPATPAEQPLPGRKPLVPRSMSKAKEAAQEAAALDAAGPSDLDALRSQRDQQFPEQPAAEIPSPMPLPPPQPEIPPTAASSDLPARVVPPEGFENAAARVTPPEVVPPEPVASQPPVESWFTSTVPLRDPEELLNAYLLGKATGSGGAINNPFKPAEQPVNGATVAEPEVPAAPPVEPVAPPETFSGLPTRVPNANMPGVLGGETQPFEAFAPRTPEPPAEEPARPAPVEPVEPVVEIATEPPAPVIDPFIARLAADVLNAPPAAEALAAEEDQDDDTSIFAALQSEWFTRRTPLEARRSLAESNDAEAPAEERWSSPGDEGWRRAAELVEQDAEPEIVSSDGLPVRVPGRNLIPGAAPVIAPSSSAAPSPRLERRRTRGLTSFQQGVSRARISDSATPEAEETDSIEEEQQ